MPLKNGNYIEKKGARSGFIVVDGDTHYPIQDKYVENAKIALIRDLKPHLHINVGDHYDFWLLSRFEKDASKLFGGQAQLQKEFDAARPYWRAVSPIVDESHLILGNHENRLNKFINNNPALHDLNALSWSRMAALPHNAIVHPYGTRIRLGSLPLTFEHGDQISKYAQHKADWLLKNKGQRNTVFGHDHKISCKMRTVWDEFGQHESFIAWGQGCGVDMKKSMEWIVDPDWQHGFSIIEVYTVGGSLRFTPHIIPIIQGRFSFNGKVYDGRKAI